MIASKTQTSLLIACTSALGLTATAPAAVVELDLPAGVVGEAVVYDSGTVFTTSVTDPSGATFDIVYTLVASATAEDPAARIQSEGESFGVLSASETDESHGGTFDGDDGEGVSVTDLAITNFEPGSSGLTADSFSVSFSTLTVNLGANKPDGLNVSFVKLGDEGGTNFRRPGDDVALDLTEVKDFDAAATEMFIQVDSGQGNNRTAIGGIGSDTEPG